MYILFDDAGKLQTARVLTEAEASVQAELTTGKRVKVKTANIFLKFGKPEPADLMAKAGLLADDMDVELAYEFAPEGEFGFQDLAADYFSADAGTTEQVAALMCLQAVPHYFRRAGKGRFKKAPRDIVEQALAAIEKKKQVQAQIDGWVAELTQGTCPQPILDQLYRILFKPDKNAPEYKAVVEASRHSQSAPLALLEKAGAISNAYQFHWQRFLFDQFPKGTGFPNLEAPGIADDLPEAPVEAFSIDDSMTTEIDDALSVRDLGSGEVTVGIHIAAPGLAIETDSPLDQVARSRLSTVYMPGHKITMLPDEVVQAYTLEAGRSCPAVSLYVKVNEETLEVTGSHTALERVPIAHNLRHDQLDGVVTEEWLLGDGTGADAPAEVQSLHGSLGFLYRLARQLKLGREEVRGKPENFNRPDYTFKLESNGVAGDLPSGGETVVIGTRSRGAPLDLMVAEAMILANSTWGQWLASLGVPGIYRSQASMAPGVKVRMSARALPHAGIGVPSYAWSTSPLRRYVDLVNQRQIIACARHGATAALAAPFKPKDAVLLSIISAFDAAYGAYGRFQSGMERYWTLCWLEQHGTTEVEATLFKDNLARVNTLPLVLPVLGSDGLPRGAQVRVRLGEIDKISLEIKGTIIEHLDTDSTSKDSSDSGDEDEDADMSAPVALAIDVSEGEDAAGTQHKHNRSPAPEA
ncbi:RNB domain-containing ribonuclease [Hydrogenophaga sp. 5NK40-0174]|uniref:ribonuclease catalytic domain-containing protein n=1 Tax=Hydrogenophaga sp. 5NK40-0174 TaxID=3127649 RepID=UPI00310B59C8